jgi:Uma2 family endonuclease
MSAAPQAATVTLEEMLALPPGLDRELIRGELRERPMTMRNKKHSRVESRATRFLDAWNDTQPEPRGQVVSGEAGFRLGRDPDTGVGIDVAYVSAEVVAGTPEKSPFFEGPPVLAVEILSPSDSQEDIDEKIALYLEMGVALVWVINPNLRTVLVLRPDAEPELFNVQAELSAEPHLPGFRLPVARLFE